MSCHPAVQRRAESDISSEELQNLVLYLKELRGHSKRQAARAPR
jgi:hypothetical protein